MNEMINLINKIKQSRYLFIGEIHGTKEIPKKTTDIVKELAINKKIIFCVELPKQLEKELNNFLDNKISKKELFSSMYLKDALYDNRINEDIILMYKELKKSKVKIICLEEYNLDKIEKRDEEMAKNFKEIIKNEKADIFIIYAGNIHLFDKTEKMGEFIINPIKIYLDKEIIDNSMTIQFTNKEKEKINFNKENSTIEYNLKIKVIKTNKEAL